MQLGFQSDAIIDPHIAKEVWWLNCRDHQLTTLHAFDVLISSLTSRGGALSTQEGGSPGSGWTVECCLFVTARDASLTMLALVSLVLINGNARWLECSERYLWR